MNLTPNSETPDKITPSLVEPTGSPDNLPSGAAPGPGKPLKVKKRGKFWKSLGLTLLVGGGASAAYLTQTTHGKKIVERVQQAGHGGIIMIQAHQNPELIFDQDKSDVVNILLVGRDQNYRQVYRNGINVAHEVDPTTPARSDSMIVVSLDRAKKTIRMVSLPRDITVRLPPNKYHVRLAKLNAAHSYGGVEMLKQTLHDELGLTIQHYAVLKFEGFMKVVDELGGVKVNVLGALHRDGTRRNLIYNDSWAIPPLHINLKPGWQMLDGKSAHAYVRFREDLEGDTGRMRRQQSLMRAMATKLKQINPARIPGIMSLIREQVETDMDDSQLASTGFFAKGLGETTRMQPLTLYGVYTERGKAMLNRSRNIALMHAVFGPTFNVSNFMKHSPTVDNFEFGPDETKPDTREVLREAGLLEGEPRVAISNEASPDQPPSSALAPGGFAAPLDATPGTGNAGTGNAGTGNAGTGNADTAPSSSSTSKDPFSFTSPEARGSQRADDTMIQGSGTANSGSERLRTEPSSRSEERPRRREHSSSGTSLRRHRSREQADSGSQQSPIPSAELNSSNSALSVESPIPRAEN